MKGSAEILTVLNELLANELTAINQYLVQGRLCDHWGYQRLAEKLAEESREEHEHANKIIARILFLEGVPDMQRYHPVVAGTTVRQAFEADLELEKAAVTALNQGITLARALGDNASEDLMTGILVAEEEGIDWLESQLGLIEMIGESNYLSQQLRS